MPGPLKPEELEAAKRQSDSARTKAAMKVVDEVIDYLMIASKPHAFPVGTRIYIGLHVAAKMVAAGLLSGDPKEREDAKRATLKIFEEMLDAELKMGLPFEAVLKDPAVVEALQSYLQGKGWT